MASTPPSASSAAITGLPTIDPSPPSTRSPRTTGDGESAQENASGTVVVEPYVVDVPPGNTKEDTCVFVDTIVRCNLQSARCNLQSLDTIAGRTVPVSLSSLPAPLPLLPSPLCSPLAGRPGLIFGGQAWYPARPAILSGRAWAELGVPIPTLSLRLRQIKWDGLRTTESVEEKAQHGRAGYVGPAGSSPKKVTGKVAAATRGGRSWLELDEVGPPVMWKLQGCARLKECSPVFTKELQMWTPEVDVTSWNVRRKAGRKSGGGGRRTPEVAGDCR
ncbi:Abscisic acid receptor [Nymphaea thermarum]|nr:Abscisic acid receptor [Nymphaea thermarum]